MSVRPGYQPKETGEPRGEPPHGKSSVMPGVDNVPGMAPLSVAHFYRQFAKWVEETGIAGECGLTRKEMIDSVGFKESRSGATAGEVGAKIQAALDDWGKLEKERMRRMLIDGEVMTVGGRFVDPERATVDRTKLPFPSPELEAVVAAAERKLQE